MIKTQIQIPDHLYREAKRVAADYEMSFAEVVRRSLEKPFPVTRPALPPLGARPSRFTSACSARSTTTNGPPRQRSRLPPPPPPRRPMTGIDTNLLLAWLNSAHPWYPAARPWFESRTQSTDLVLCELVLTDLYGLLRNPKLWTRPLTAPEAVAMIQRLREHPHWELIDYPGGLMDAVWQHASAPRFRLSPHLRRPPCPHPPPPRRHRIRHRHRQGLRRFRLHPRLEPAQLRLLDPATHTLLAGHP